jgi:hypothetical protein
VVVRPRLQFGLGEMGLLTAARARRKSVAELAARGDLRFRPHIAQRIEKLFHFQNYFINFKLI